RVHFHTVLYSPSLHDALPIYEIANLFHLGIGQLRMHRQAEDAPADGLSLRQTRSIRKDSPLICRLQVHRYWVVNQSPDAGALARSEEHTSELQSRGHLVCRLL